jgi:flagellar hook protein FlgE
MTILNTSVSGMLADQNWLSSISQNVANANTTGYKELETEFSTLVDQASNGAADGAGVQTSAISLNALQGNVTSSQTTTSLAVQGAGFFIVSDASGAIYLTRNGSFVPDASGNLVNSAGYYLMADNLEGGQSATPTNQLSGLQKVNVVSTGLTATPTTSASAPGNLPSTAPTIAAADLPSTNSASSTYTNETSVVVYDNLGAAHTVNLYFSNEGDGTWEVDAFAASTTDSNPFDSALELGSGTLTFGSTGSLTSGSPLTLQNPTGSTILSSGQTISLDLSKTTQLASSFSVTPTSNGDAPAALSGVSIGTDGTLSFNYASGASIAAYHIPLANVESPDNLTSVNGNVYTASAASGPIFVGSANSGSFGAIKSSSLESSTVDIATELTDMIQAQSAYEANSKVFQTGANILDVLNGLKS